jgi:polyisoprenoid-binding protein YceI
MTATQTSTWTIDQAHSTVNFSLRHMMVTKVTGQFERFSGTIVFDPANVDAASVEVEIETASITTRSADRDTHLRSADFFDAETYPTITFKSTGVHGHGDSFHVHGDLTMHGVTREVVLDTTFNGTGTSPFGHTVAGFEAETKIKRGDFGLNWNAALETGGVMVSDEIRITLDIEATQ